MYGRDYRVGYRINVLEQGSLNLKIGVDAERRESPMFQLQERSGGTDQRVLGLGVCAVKTGQTPR